MITAPKSFIDDDKFKKILLYGQNCLVQKRVSSPTLDSDRYLSTHALTYVTKGSLLVKTDFAVTTVNQKQIVFLPIGVYLLSDLIPEGGEFEAFAFFFDEKLANRFLGNVEPTDEKKELEPLVINETSQMRSYLNALLKIYGEKTEKNATNWKLLELLNLIAKTNSIHQFVSRLNRAQNRKKYGIRAFMEKNFDRNLSIEDYAHLTGRSISTFHRDFKKQYSVGPKTWLLKKRLNKAKKQLEDNSEIKVADLAYMTGYGNTSHFIKAFQKEFGITPKQHQLAVRKNTVV